MQSDLDVVAAFTRTAPVNLAGIFQVLGVDYKEEPISSGASGWIERNGSKYTVVVNSTEPEQRKRFTAAHELAHYLLHRDLMDHGSRMNRHTDRLFDKTALDRDTPFRPHHETQANKLAAEIIMPASLVREKHDQAMSTDDMARAFRVSRIAMEIRLNALGLI